MRTIAIVGGKLQATEACYLARHAGIRSTVIDIDPDAPARGMCDEFVCGNVIAEDPQVLAALNKADMVLPAMENDAVLEKLVQLSERDGFILAFDMDAYRISESKHRSDALFHRLGVPAPRYYPEGSFPFFAKEDGGSGSHGARRLDTQEEMDAVIRIGVDLIQGFYTARPTDGFMEEIARDVRDEIISLNMQAGESRTKKTYIVDKEQEVMLMPLVTTEHYTEFVINRRELSIVGNPRISVDVLIRIPDNTTTTIHLRRVNLDSYQRHPCIEIGNNCDVTLVIEGTAVLNRKGIRVPESSRLTVSGDGKLTIYGTGDRAYGIGGDSTQTIGRILIDMSGDIHMKLDGKECVGLGGGYSNRKAGIFIERCKNLYAVASGERALGIGICNNIAPLSLKETRIKMEINADRAVAVGSLTAETDITLSNVKLNYTSSGDMQVTIGTLASKNVKLVARHIEMQSSMKAKTCIGIGCRDGSADIRLDSSDIDLKLEGAEVVGFGTKTKEGRGQFEKTAFYTSLNSADQTEFGYEPENMNFLMCKV